MNHEGLFAAPAVRVERDADGCTILRHGLDLDLYDQQVGDWVRRWARETPDRIALGEFCGHGTLSTLTYRELRVQCDSVAQAIITRRLSADRPIALLSEKSLAHAVLTLAALQCGVPACPISPAYSLRPEARNRLLASLRATTPGLVLVDDASAYSDVIALLPADVEVVYERNEPTTRAYSRPFAEFLRTAPSKDVDRAFANIDPDAPAKILLTSGSTGEPKAVIITQRMMCSNAKAQSQLLPLLLRKPPVIVDWQPWHHCGGSCYNFHSALSNGGSYYIDHGKPTSEEAFAPTISALKNVSPTIHFNVPQGYERLAFHLERDAELRRSFFSELDLLVYSGAAMPAPLWKTLDRLASRERGSPTPIVSAYGMTELAPLHATVHWADSSPGMIGLPIPGSMIKLVPTDNKLELRAKGPNVSPGYHRSSTLTAQAFDEDGWFRSGDAVSFADPVVPPAGLRLEGRLTDQFKLQSGTWVRVGELRTEVLAATSPLLEDVLIAGEGRAEIGALAIPNVSACRELLKDPSLTLGDLASSAALKSLLFERLVSFNTANSVSSRRIARALLIDDVPSLASGETTDKGHINQKLAVQRREGLVARLFGETDLVVTMENQELMS